MMTSKKVDSDPKQVATSEAQVWEQSPYYDHAEQWTWLFWDDQQPFLPLFRQLDLRKTLELACGHGRHGEHILKNFPGNLDRLVMMDILASNVEYCRARIGTRQDVSILENNGVDFQPIEDQSLTAVFCYDAMVHFDREVVRSYVSDIRRVLVPGGRALLHHSNYSVDNGVHFGSNPHARAYMTAGLFRSYAEEAGLAVLEQRIMPWGEVANLDCISLLEYSPA
jgi:SAM-dependent methyltransferase